MICLFNDGMHLRCQCHCSWQLNWNTSRLAQLSFFAASQQAVGQMRSHLALWRLESRPTSREASPTHNGNPYRVPLPARYLSKYCVSVRIKYEVGRLTSRESLVRPCLNVLALPCVD